MPNLWRAVLQATTDISRPCIYGNSCSSHKLSWLPRRPQHHRLSILPLKPSKPSKMYQGQLVCGAQLFEDVPFVIAISACVLSSLVFTKKDGTNVQDPKGSPLGADDLRDGATKKDGTNVQDPKGSPLGADDLRDGAMTIISFVPIFNWLSWIFAWLDTSEQRYLLYASVYLAPYIRSGFSFSSDENWLLVLSYAACIAHIQMEIGIQTGNIEVNIDGFKRFGKTEAMRMFPPKEELRNPIFEQDLSELELSEFDKKLSSLRNNAASPAMDSSQEEKDIVEEDIEASDK